jgi:hypothetical protein
MANKTNKIKISPRQAVLCPLLCLSQTVYVVHIQGTCRLAAATNKVKVFWTKKPLACNSTGALIPDLRTAEKILWSKNVVTEDVLRRCALHFLPEVCIHSSRRQTACLEMLTRISQCFVHTAAFSRIVTGMTQCDDVHTSFHVWMEKQIQTLCQHGYVRLVSLCNADRHLPCVDRQDATSHWNWNRPSASCEQILKQEHFTSLHIINETVDKASQYTTTEILCCTVILILLTWDQKQRSSIA